MDRKAWCLEWIMRSDFKLFEQKSGIGKPCRDYSEKHTVEDIGGKKMFIRIKGKSETLENLEKVQNLIAEAEKILYRLQNQIEFELVDDAGKADDKDPDE